MEFPKIISKEYLYCSRWASRRLTLYKKLQCDFCIFLNIWLMQAAYNVGGQTINVDMIQSSILGCRMSRPGQVIPLTIYHLGFVCETSFDSFVNSSCSGCVFYFLPRQNLRLEMHEKHMQLSTLNLVCILHFVQEVILILRYVNPWFIYCKCLSVESFPYFDMLNGWIGPYIHTQESFPGPGNSKRRVHPIKLQYKQGAENPVAQDGGVFCEGFKFVLSWFAWDAWAFLARSFTEEHSTMSTQENWKDHWVDTAQLHIPFSAIKRTGITNATVSGGS